MEYLKPNLSVEKDKTFYKGYYGDDQPYYLTGQEHLMIGGTPKIIQAPPEWYIPYAVLSGDLTIKEASRIRKQIGYCTIGSFVTALMNLPSGTLALSLEPLDPKTGITLQDPRILGFLAGINHHRIIKVKDRDLTAEYRKACQKNEDPKNAYSLFHFR